MNNPSRSAATPERILQRLDWQVIRRLDGLLQGDYRSLFYGYGVDFADLREYQPEDDIRYIDWNVTARMDTPYVRQYVEDREVTAWFLLDLSPSMDFGAQNVKQNVLVDVVATLARLLTRHGNRVGAILYMGQPALGQKSNGRKNGSGWFGRRVDRVDLRPANGHRPGRPLQRTIPAGGGRLQALRIINDLLKQVHPPQNSPAAPRAGATELARLIESGLNTIKKRSLVFVVSDFISTPGWERPLALLNQRHEVLAIHLTDPREVELPDVGPVILEDAETGEQLYVDTHDKAFRTRFQAAVQQRQAELNQVFKRAGVDVWSLSTEEDLVRAIVRFVSIRKQHRHANRTNSLPAAPQSEPVAVGKDGQPRPGKRQ